MNTVLMTNHFPRSSAVVVAGGEQEHEQEQEHEGGRSAELTTSVLSVEERREFVVCEQAIESGFRKAAEALATVRDRRLYREEFDTFEAYIKGRRSTGLRHSHRLAASFSVIQDLLEYPATPIYSADGVQQTVAPLPLALPSSESVARPLVGLEPDERRSVWAEAVAVAPGGKPTAKDVEAVIERRRPAAYDETYVLCREPMEGVDPSMVHGKPRYQTEGGYTTDPAKAMKFSKLEDAKMKNGSCDDEPVLLADAVTRFQNPETPLTAQERKFGATKWPEANEYGVYDDLGCERVEYKSNNASAAIRLLQVGEHDWAVGYKYLYEIGNRTGSAIGILNRRLFSARDDGLRYGAEMIAAGQRTIMQAIETTITPAQKAEANKLFKWATGQMRDPAPAPVRQEIKLAESKGAKVDPAVKKLAAKIYGIGIAHFEQARAWDELKNHSKEGWFAIARWHLSEIKSLAEVVKEEAAAIVKEEWHRNGNGARKAARAKQEAGRRRKAAVKRGRRPEGRTTSLRRRR